MLTGIKWKYLLFVICEFEVISLLTIFEHGMGERRDSKVYISKSAAAVELPRGKSLGKKVYEFLHSTVIMLYYGYCILFRIITDYYGHYTIITRLLRGHYIVITRVFQGF